jgi:hypothetical protein
MKKMNDADLIYMKMIATQPGGDLLLPIVSDL